MRRFALLILALIVLLPTGYWAYKHLSWLTPNGIQVQHVIQQSEEARQSLLVAPIGFRDRPVPHRVVLAMQVKAGRVLSRYFTGRLLRFLLHATNLAIAGEEHPHAVNRGWGVEPADFGELSLLGDSAVATATIISRTVDDGPMAVNKFDITYHLVRVAGSWRIEREDLRCLQCG